MVWGDHRSKGPLKQTFWTNPWVVGGTLLVVSLALTVWLSAVQAGHNRSPLILGQLAHMGSFDVLPGHLQCNLRERMSEFGVTDTARGQFCIVAVRLINVSDTAQRLEADWTLLAAREQFPSQSEEGRGIEPLQNLFPGEGADVSIVFDIPIESYPTLLRIEPVNTNGNKVEYELAGSAR